MIIRIIIVNFPPRGLCCSDGPQRGNKRKQKDKQIFRPCCGTCKWR